MCRAFSRRFASAFLMLRNSRVRRALEFSVQLGHQPGPGGHAGLQAVQVEPEQRAIHPHLVLLAKALDQLPQVCEGRALGQEGGRSR